MYGLEKLLRMKEGGAYAVVPLPDKVTEGRLYAASNEACGIPAPIVDLVAFCKTHGIDVDVHRKPVTHGCKEAIDARSIACGREIQLHQELKAVVLKTAERVKVAVYMRGDCELPRQGISRRGKRYGVDCDLLSRKTGFSILGMDDDPQLISGRLNPVTLFLDYADRMEHFFDIPDDILNEPMYTNGGCNTWGIRIDNTSRMMQEIGAQRAMGLCCPIAVGRAPGEVFPWNQPNNHRLDADNENIFSSEAKAEGAILSSVSH